MAFLILLSLVLGGLLAGATYFYFRAREELQEMKRFS